MPVMNDEVGRVRRTKKMEIRVAEEELVAYQKAAAEKGLDLSEWVRKYLNLELTWPRVSRDWTEVRSVGHALGEVSGDAVRAERVEAVKSPWDALAETEEVGKTSGGRPWGPEFKRLELLGVHDPTVAAEEMAELLERSGFMKPRGWERWNNKLRAAWLDENHPLPKEQAGS